MRILLLLAGVTIFLLGDALPAVAAEPSASDVIKKSETAYAAVKTYVGTTTVRGKTDTGAMKLDQVSTAKVNFIRPGKVRIEGKTASLGAAGMGGQPFAIVSDGTKTWKSFGIRNSGAFSEVQNIAMAGMGGVAQGAAEGIPAALMKGDGVWTLGHDPLSAELISVAKLAGHEPIDGADCYKLVAKNTIRGDVTLWIDSKSFLLRQMTRKINESQLAELSKKAAELMKKIGKEMPASTSTGTIKSQSTVFSFTIDKVDGPVDAKLFTNPTKK